MPPIHDTYGKARVRVMRVARIISDALETFGSEEKALAWLRRACAPLQGEAPLDLLDTEEGARQVEYLIVANDGKLVIKVR